MGISSTETEGHSSWGALVPGPLPRPSLTLAPMRWASPPGSFVQGLPCHLVCSGVPAPRRRSRSASTRLLWDPPVCAGPGPPLPGPEALRGSVLRRNVSAPCGSCINCRHRNAKDSCCTTWGPGRGKGPAMPGAGQGRAGRGRVRGEQLPPEIVPTDKMPSPPSRPNCRCIQSC